LEFLFPHPVHFLFYIEELPLSLRDLDIRNAKTTGKLYRIFDGDGLYLEVSSVGGKYWRFKYRFAGKEKRLALGVYPEIGLSDARERHREARKALALGNDPGELKRAAKQAAILQNTHTFEAMAREWHSNSREKWSNNHAVKLLDWLEADVFPKLGGRPVTKITASDLLSVIRNIEERGACDVAHRVLQICSQIFNYAVLSDRAGNNPATSLRGVLKPVLRKNRAYLKSDELPEFLEKLKAYDGDTQTKLAVRFLLLTFVRTGEMRGALKAEMNRDKAEWRIPPERMKMREPHIVPLSKQALDVITQLEALNPKSAYLFPNQQRAIGIMSENTILYALYRMGYHSRATGHGFRSTASTILNEHGFTPDVIERQLAHAERNEVRAAYNHAQYLPERRKMMQWWANYLDNCGRQKKRPR
jgi:integrase